jgi:anaerobic nitric oxide reductase flavorubredoxin
MATPLTNHVTYVGKIDWELRTFHGEELSTHRGSTYNAYLIRDEKNVLIDTVWAPFAKEFVDELEKVIDLKTIDLIVANHGEVDHSGALPELMRRIPDVPIYCTANAVKSIRGQYHQDWNFHVVKTGDKIKIGQGELIFIEAPMLHWPDTMFTYYTGEDILFSNDAFGQHYATAHRFNDQVDQAELYQELMKYYANILTPFSKFVTKKIDEILGLHLPVKMIFPSHGVLWRDNPLQAIEAYTKWAADYQENQITILYDTMWNGTRRMAELIAAGIQEAKPDLSVKVFNVGRSDKNDAITEVFRSKAIVVGSPTVNRTILSGMAGILEEIKGMGFKNKKAATFGAYGWSGESPKILSAKLAEAGFSVIEENLKVLWYPDDAAAESCKAFGRRIAELMA